MTVYRHRTRSTPAQVHLEREGLSFHKERGNGPLYYYDAVVMSAPWIVPHQRRHYRLVAETDTLAAKEALRLFGEELDFVTIEV